MGAPFRLPLAALLAFGLLACPAAEEQGKILSFTATPSRVAPGDSVQLAWTSSNAAACLLSGVGEVPASSATLVNPTTTTTYELYCNGARATAVVTVTARATITRFDATPAEVAPDTVVELTWASEGAESCALTPGFGAVDLTGSRIVVPTQTTTYELTCTGGGATATKTVTVTVVPVTSVDTPTNVQVTPQDGALRVSWTQGPGGSNVYFAEGPGITQGNIASLAGGTVYRRVPNPFTITGLVNGRAYYLRVSAVSGTLESALSAEVSGTPSGSGTGTDPLFGEQWYLSQASGEDMRVTGAWSAGIKGEGVKVVVVDEGIDLGHEDLRQNVAVGLSWDYLGNAPTYLAEHGTAVAGLLGARDLNNVGVRGAAPRVSLFSFNLLQDLTSANEYDAMVRQKGVVAVSNNSWGDVDDSTGFVSEPDPQWLRGVAEGTSTGRGGKGICYFWASGNGGSASEPYRDNSNFDGQANSRYVFAISGVGKNGKLADYAEAGANVLVAAPTEGDDGFALTTTDITGTAGYNDGNTSGEHANVNYTAAMSGTSASTPLAAAVGALVLQARPELSWRDVRRVLALSARKADPTNTGWSTNGAGLPIHHGFGFGVVDAAAAVALARTITPVGPEVRFTTPLQSPALPVPDNGAAVTSTLVVSGSGVGKIEFVELEVNAPHARSGDLGITLAKQGGATDIIHPVHECAPDPQTNQPWCQDLTPYTFGTVRHLDEAADGTWTLTVRDGSAGVTGTLSSWRLTFYGRQ
jgi:kexin